LFVNFSVSIIGEVRQDADLYYRKHNLDYIDVAYVFGILLPMDLGLFCQFHDGEFCFILWEHRDLLCVYE